MLPQNFDPQLSLLGNHVELEPLQTSHAENLAEAARDGELWKLRFTSVPHPSKTTAYIGEALSQRDRGVQQPFAVRRLSDDRIVGCTRYYDIDQQHRNRSIGYTWYAASAQRTAVNTECKLLLLRHAFEREQCISVAFHTDNLNLRSQAAIARLGAVKEGVLRNHRIMPDGRIRHTWCYSITSEEWPAIKAQLTKRLARG